MTAHTFLHQLHELGVILTPSPDGTLRYKAPKGTMTPALLDTIRQHKAALHALVEAWSERAAIAEYCGSLSRPAAEALAWQCVLAHTPETMTSSFMRARNSEMLSLMLGGIPL